MEPKQSSSLDTQTLSVPSPDSAQETAAHKKRTVGNRLFDLVVYPTIAFGAVFTFSVWATEKAMFSTGKIRGAFDGLANAMHKAPMLRNQPFDKVKGHAMVLVSFLAGSLLIAPIKLFEDRRGTISQKFDHVLGTTPEDPSHYKKEPKQSWLSVMGGRVVTFGSVLVLALSVGSYINKGSMKVATKLTGEHPPGMNPELASKKWQRAYVASFETFYTALCAGMVYVLSRTFAKKLNKKDVEQDAQVSAPAQNNTSSNNTIVEDTGSATTRFAQLHSVKTKPIVKAESFTQAVDHSRESAIQPAL